MEKVMKECEICGGLFETARPTQQKYCAKCGENPARARKRIVKAVAINRKHEDREIVCRCESCGITMKTKKKIRFCSLNCKRAFIFSHKQCYNCHQPLQSLAFPAAFDAGEYCCSKECQEQYQRKIYKERGFIHVCKVCGKEFIKRVVHTPSQKIYCCEKCANQDGATLKKAKPALDLPMETVKCPVCGKLFERVKGSSYPFCGDECQDVVIRAEYMQKEREKKAQKQAQTKQKQVEGKKKFSSKPLSLCGRCKTPYLDCIRMTSNFQYSPEGAAVRDGKVLTCPLFKD